MFLIRQDSDQYVYDLKDAIKRENEDLSSKNTRTVTLFLVRRKSDGAWLSDDE